MTKNKSKNSRSSWTNRRRLLQTIRVEPRSSQRRLARVEEGRKGRRKEIGREEGKKGSRGGE